MMLAYRSAILERFRHETCGSEDCCKIAKFWVKATSQGHCSWGVDDVQRWSRFAQKGHNWGWTWLLSFFSSQNWRHRSVGRERKAFCYDWADKRKIETGAVGDTKRRVSEVFRELRNTLAQMYYIWGDYFEGAR